MCGIAGQVSTGGPLDKDLVMRMAKRIQHRGPDRFGMYEDEKVVLAHQRLSIIDLSSDGNQPMSNEEGTVWITYNGEVYNYIEIRARLEGEGYKFRTKTDTEVILKAYDRWGDACITMFDGMWAFVIWDKTLGRAFFSRDRYGIKPLYFTEVGGTFLFASEIKALLEHQDVGTKPDEAKVMMFLEHGVMDDDGRTLYEGIYQLQPGHTMVISQNTKDSPVTFRFLQTGEPLKMDETNPELTTWWNETDFSLSIREALTHSIRLHLRSDVPVGTCLSGGIDSSSIVMITNTLIKTEHPRSVGEMQKTFSITFKDKKYDESKYIDEIRKVAEITPYRKILTKSPTHDEIKELIYTQDGPFPSLSVYAQNKVMELAKGQVRVLLDGQGADELFAGYLPYVYSYIRGLAEAGQYREALVEAVGAVRWWGIRTLISSYRKQRTRTRYRKSMLREEKGMAPNPRYCGPLNKVLQDEMRVNLPALLHWEDRNSMAYSIEARVPFLENRLVDETRLLPTDQRIRGGVTKYGLREAMRGLVPEKILNRRDKKGFDVPEEEWICQGRAFTTFGSISIRSRPYWNGEVVDKIFYKVWLKNRPEYKRESSSWTFAQYDPIFWRIFCTEIWLQMFFDRGKERLNPWPID